MKQPAIALAPWHKARYMKAAFRKDKAVKHTVNQIRADEIALLLGIYQSLKDGDTIVEELMKPIRNSKEAKNKAVQEALDASDKEVVDTETGEIKEPKKKNKAE